ncbi:SprT family zinc-dependent metalloprotease [Janthinobacterium sp.]|uniref:M48 family metallopeptidase n=1 Tax=Janthinobacterium sp. TaxID=1871054 RepID=UPI00293D3E23|nr:SprT family zinc-dependent metalloprotease [Janthinobacterium sp.]
MHPLLRYTLDLFEPNMPEAQVNTILVAPKVIAKSQPFVAGQLLEQAVAPANFAHPQANRQVRLDDAVVAYAFARGRRKTIGFVVGPEGLVVRAPRWTPLGEVDAALREKAPWILRKLQETQERQVRHDSARIEWRDGTTLPLLGETVVVKLDPTHGFTGKGAQLDAAMLDADADADAQAAPRTLRVGLPHAATPDQIKDSVQAWLMRYAKAHFTQRLDHFAPQLQVRWHSLRLSNASTRWGSAKSDGSIRLNWRLIHFSPTVVDYVVAHELSHLREMNHSPRFWDTVRTVVPDYAQLRGQLKDDAVPRW